MRKLILYTLLSLCSLAVSAREWQTDSLLGSPFEMRSVKLPPDYSGPQRCTLVRLLSTQARETRRGVLYIHGFNDYFFQSEMADSFVARGYDFYAVDLHRYGRSLMPGQRHCDVRSLDQYFPDIDSALVAMRRYGIRHIILMGHSTGGLIASYFMSSNPQAPVEALLLNSPFLDWNMGRLEPFIPLVSALGAILPDIRVSSGDARAYGCSLRADCHGEWTYDTHLKTDPSPKVTLGWIRAIHEAQVYLRRHPRSIRVPVLLMYSARSFHGTDWTPEASGADAVLDVGDIARYGSNLSADICRMKVEGGLHDLSLSSPGVRKAWYRAMFRWLGNLNDNNNHQSK
ncbi:MAG: lysophospholipase [Duncaniella sp.]|nr:lysophospholipase [Duncaniella sp.]